MAKIPADRVGGDAPWWGASLTAVADELIVVVILIITLPERPF
jgi:hypothetical protein